jgi:D-alanyl-D-alanine carboxypeptidase/D-alanyl-D-alanine-endopeptidase (penicillin-binding protein 4)
VSLLPHPEYAAALFRALWQELGGTLHGKSRGGTVSASATLFATHTSQPLSELIRDINKFSNNVMARQLFLSLSAPAPSQAERTNPISAVSTTLSLRKGDAAGDPMPAASPLRSTQVVHDWLALKKLDFPELVLENGSGLSRKERISARNMALLLHAAQDSPLQAEFEASLPIVGVDGSMKKRLKESAAANHAHLKSGTLEGVKTVAGYVQSRSGRLWSIVFFINHPNARLGQAAQDALIEWVQQQH